jgi:hypothetical protein
VTRCSGPLKHDLQESIVRACVLMQSCAGSHMPPNGGPACVCVLLCKHVCLQYMVGRTKGLRVDGLQEGTVCAGVIGIAVLMGLPASVGPCVRTCASKTWLELTRGAQPAFSYAACTAQGHSYVPLRLWIWGRMPLPILKDGMVSLITTTNINPLSHSLSNSRYAHAY